MIYSTSGNSLDNTEEKLLVQESNEKPNTVNLRYGYLAIFFIGIIATIIVILIITKKT